MPLRALSLGNLSAKTSAISPLNDAANAAMSAAAANTDPTQTQALEDAFCEAQIALMNGLNDLGSYSTMLGGQQNPG